MNNNQNMDKVLSYIHMQYVDSTLADRVYYLLGELYKHSPETALHCIDTANIALALAQKLHLDPKATARLYTAAVMHDIGKRGISADLLSKKDITLEELHTLREGHVLYTKNILIQAQFPQEIIDIAYKHHERLDGSGYPEKIGEDEMTLEDKILQVADNVSAMTLSRAYRNGALSKEKCVSELEKMSEDHKLDPAITSIAIDYVHNELHRDDDIPVS